MLIGIVLVKLAASCACATVQCDTPSTVEKEILINETGWSKSHLRDQLIYGRKTRENRFPHLLKACKLAVNAICSTMQSVEALVALPAFLEPIGAPLAHAQEALLSCHVFFNVFDASDAV